MVERLRGSGRFVCRGEPSEACSLPRSSGDPPGPGAGRRSGAGRRARRPAARRSRRRVLGCRWGRWSVLVGPGRRARAVVVAGVPSAGASAVPARRRVGRPVASSRSRRRRVVPSPVALGLAPPALIPVEIAVASRRAAVRPSWSWWSWSRASPLAARPGCATVPRGPAAAGVARPCRRDRRPAGETPIASTWLGVARDGLRGPAPGAPARPRRVDAHGGDGAGAGSVCWISTAPPAVTTAAASSVATCPAPGARASPTPTRPRHPVPAAPPAASGAARRAPPPAPPTPEQVGEHAERPERRHERGEPPADPAQLVRNSRQPAQSRMWRRAMALGRTPRSWATISSSRISEQAVSRASSAWARPTRARTSSDFTAGTDDPEGGGHVGVGHPAELAHEQRRALLVGQPAHVGDQPPSDSRCSASAIGSWLGARTSSHHLGRRRRGPAQLVDAAVVGDPVQPGAQRQLAVGWRAGRSRRGRRCPAARPRRPGATRQHLARVGEQPLPVAVVDHPERLVVAGAEQRHELLVGAKAKQRAPPIDSPSPGYGCRCWECGGFHVIPCAHSNGAAGRRFRILEQSGASHRPRCQDKDTITCLTSV